MATIRDTNGDVIGRSEADRYRNIYGEWLYYLVDGGTISDKRILKSNGEWVAEIKGDRIYDTSGNWLGEFRGDRFYDTGGNWKFTIY